MHAHEFHRTSTEPASLGRGAWTVDGAAEGFALDPAGTGRPTVHASYLHVHWAGTPSLATSFADAVHVYAASPTVGPPAPPGLRLPTSPAPTLTRGAPSWPTASVPTPSTTGQPSSASQVATPDDPYASLDHHGDDEVRGPGLVDLAVNVRVSEPPRWLADVIRATTATLAAYPDASEARDAIARRHGVTPDAVLPTSGGAEAFTLIARAVEGRHPLVVHPQFTEPEAALRRAGRVPDRLVLRADTAFALHPALVDPRADLVFVGNPTNPTGVLHPRATLEALRAPHRVLVVDEAFADAVAGEGHSMVGPDLEGVLVLRSLTKTWGVAGLRAGYVVGDPRLVAALARHQPHWSVSTPAAAVMVATAASEAVMEAERAGRQAALWRRHLVSLLESIGLRPVPGEAPFVLVQVGHGVRESLRHNGFAVRRCDTFPGLDAGWIRVAVRDPETSDRFCAVLAGILAGPAAVTFQAAANLEVLA